MGARRWIDSITPEQGELIRWSEEYCQTSNDDPLDLKLSTIAELAKTCDAIEEALEDCPELPPQNYVEF